MGLFRRFKGSITASFRRLSFVIILFFGEKSGYMFVFKVNTLLLYKTCINVLNKEVNL